MGVFAFVEKSRQPVKPIRRDRESAIRLPERSECDGLHTFNRAIFDLWQGLGWQHRAAEDPDNLTLKEQLVHTKKVRTHDNS